MKTKITFLPVVVMALLATSCAEKKTEAVSETKTEKHYESLEKASWLIGKWGNTTPEGALSEFWEKKNDSTYHGESYFVVGGKDTVFSESIELTEANGKLAYIVTMPGQNNEKPVRFDLTSGDENSMVFENPAHDFPNKITYKKVSNDSLVAEIHGTQNGKRASETFAMKRQ